jgi:hypothetical protein
VCGELRRALLRSRWRFAKIVPREQNAADRLCESADIAGPLIPVANQFAQSAAYEWQQLGGRFCSGSHHDMAERTTAFAIKRTGGSFGGPYSSSSLPGRGRNGGFDDMRSLTRVLPLNTIGVGVARVI